MRQASAVSERFHGARGFGRRGAAVLAGRTAALLVLAVVATGLLARAAPGAAPLTRVTLDGSMPGRTFDGLGAISGGGGNSRLLIDYPPRERARILDLLFKPDVGASLQLLKVEIGGGTNTTDGAEPSVEPQRGDVDCDAGYEWWLMREAKARNPAIRLYGLAWGAPGWVGEGRQTFFTASAVRYVLDWLGCARSHGLRIDYLGGWNERGYDRRWYEALRAALDAAGYGSVELVAGDGGWAVAGALLDDPAFAAAVDIVGVHYPCSGGNGGDAASCRSPADAAALGKPLWASENGSQPLVTGAAAMARSIGRGYLDGGLTAYLAWPALAALYPNLPYADVGLIRANEPWSGSYAVGSQLWIAAQWTQFAAPGWRFVDSASGSLDGDEQEGTYVTLKAPGTDDYSTIVEATTLPAPRRVRFTVGAGLASGPVHVRATDTRSADPSRWFIRGDDLVPVGGSFTLLVRPGWVYTLTSTTGQRKGDAASPPSARLALPYRDGFDRAPERGEAAYLAALEGDFQIRPCGGRRGGCLRQVVTQPPVRWLPATESPEAILGDRRWANYDVGVDVRLDEPGEVRLMGRLGDWFCSAGRCGLAGYALRVRDTGRWQLAVSSGRRTATLAAGAVPPLGVHAWHRLDLAFAAATVTARIDGTEVASRTGHGPAHGEVGIGLGGYDSADFDNLLIAPTS